MRTRFARIGTLLVAGIALAGCKAGDNLPADARCPVECVVDCAPDVTCPDYAFCAAPPKYLCPPGYRPLASASTSAHADTPGARSASPVAR